MNRFARLIGGCVVLAFVATVLGALIPGKRADVVAGDGVTVYLAAGPIHYDILLPADGDTRLAFGFLSEFGLPVDAPGVDWIVVGWGSRAFYTATGDYTDLRAGTMWDAVSGDSAVMRFDVAGPLMDHPRLRPLQISAAQLATLRGVILSDLQRDGQGRVIPLSAEGFTAWDMFFAAEGRFSLLRTCNVWIGQTLRRAGVPFGVWTPAPFGVTLSRWWFAL